MSLDFVIQAIISNEPNVWINNANSMEIDVDELERRLSNYAFTYQQEKI